MKKIFFATILLLFTFIVFNPTYAQAPCGGSDPNSNYDYQSSSANCPPTINQVGNIFVAVVDVILVLAIVVFFFMVVINGFTFITANADQQRLEGARKSLVFSVVGFGLIFSSFIILNVIRSVTGITGGFSVSSNGNIQFQVLSTFTATPLPPGSVNTNVNPSN